MKTIGITGGTGFVGHHLAEQLIELGYHVVVFTRDIHKAHHHEKIKYSYWSPSDKKFDMTYLNEIDAVIHLAGAGVADKRWTAKRKKEIVDSRIFGTNFLIEKLKEHAPRCKTFIAASAIGFYGPDKSDDNQSFDETSDNYPDFLGSTCAAWEKESMQAAATMRTTILRFGIVLGNDSGAFPQFNHPQNFGVKPILGSGKQIISWIHIDDLCNAIIWALKEEKVHGVFNAVAPNPVSQRQLMDTIDKHKSGFRIPIPVPSLMLQIAMGEMSIEILKSATVSANKISQAGFQFKFPTIDKAVSDLLH